MLRQSFKKKKTVETKEENKPEEKGKDILYFVMHQNNLLIYNFPSFPGFEGRFFLNRIYTSRQ